MKGGGGDKDGTEDSRKAHLVLAFGFWICKIYDITFVFLVGKKRETKRRKMRLKSIAWVGDCGR